MIPANRLNVDSLPQRIPLAQALELTPEQFAASQIVSVSVLRLSVRPTNCLANQGIQTLGHLLSLSIADLMAIPAAGQTSIREIVKQVYAFFASKPPSSCNHPMAGLSTPLTLRDEWATFSSGTVAEISIAQLSLPPEVEEKLGAAGICEGSDLLDWTWDAIRQRLGEDTAEELLEALVTAAQETRTGKIGTGNPDQPSFDEKRGLLEQRWAGSTINRFGLQIRTCNLLHADGVTTLDELLRGLQPLCRTLCYDLPAFNDVWERLVALGLRQGEPLKEWERLLADEACPACLDDVAARMQRSCNETQWTVISLRYRIEDDGDKAAPEVRNGDADDEAASEPYTIADIARFLDISRERVYKLEARAVIG